MSRKMNSQGLPNGPNAVPEFVRESRSFFKAWERKGVVDFLDVHNELILFTADSTIMDKEVRENVFKEVTVLHHQLDQGGASEPAAAVSPLQSSTL